MVYANIPVQKAPCELKPEIKERGIYETTMETRETLTEVLNMLEVFKREIKARACAEKAEKAMGPTCFKDEVFTLNDLAFAIKGDLSSIISEFR